MKIRSILFSLFLLFAGNAVADTVLIAVASNLTDVMNRIIKNYEQVSGNSVRVTYGSSGNFTTQILQGAPYQLFVSASKQYVDILYDKGKIDHQGIEFSRGPIGFYIPDGSMLAEVNGPEAVANALKFGAYRKIAMANPEHAPYGVAAAQSLRNIGVWALETRKTILAENVAQVIQYALSGEVDVAIIPYSFMEQSRVGSGGRFFLIPDELYDPVVQYLIVLDRDSKAIASFVTFLFTPSSVSLMQEYGYHIKGKH